MSDEPLTVASFLEEIKGRGQAAYRGQPWEDWWVTCSATRRIIRGPIVLENSVSHLLVGYTADLLDGAKRHANCSELENCQSDLEILAQLQHHGAATALIDFTLDPLVALWFACSEYPNDDGAVYVLPRSEIREIDNLHAQKRAMVQCFHKADLRTQQPLYLWHPPQTLQGRSVSQKSVFVFGVPFLWPKWLWKVIIHRDAKSTLLDELRRVHGITRATLFPDFAGYARNNSIPRSIDAGRLPRFWVDTASSAPSDDEQERAKSYIDCGNAYCEMGRYREAIVWFTQAIDVGAEQLAAHLNRSHARLQLDDLEGALADCDMGVALLEETPERFAPEQVASIYWARHTIHSRLGQHEQRIADAKHAIKLGLKRYRAPDGRVIPFPADFLEYRS